MKEQEMTATFTALSEQYNQAFAIHEPAIRTGCSKACIHCQELRKLSQEIDKRQKELDKWKDEEWDRTHWADGSPGKAVASRPPKHLR